jgi:DNA polymerase-3 subunit gamma/tau
LFEALMHGNIKAALDLFHDQYQAGADPQAVMRDLLEVCHWVSRIKVTPVVADDPTVADFARERGRTLAAALSVPVLQRFWQMLLKGQGELRQAGADVAAAEMLLIRLCFAADLPAPADLMKALSAAGATSLAPTSQAAAPVSPAAGTVLGQAPLLGAGGARAMQQAGGRQAPLHRAEPAPELQPESRALAERAQAVAAAEPASLAALVTLADEKRDPLLKGYLYNYVHLVRFEPGRIEFRPPADAPADVAGVLSERLQRWTGRRWGVVVSAETGQPTLAETARDAALSREAEVMAQPLVQAALAAFPGAVIRTVRDVAPEDGFDPEHEITAQDDDAREEGGDR